MIHANKELDLLRSYRRLMRGEKGRSGLLHHFLTPAAACLLVCVLIWGVLLLMNSSLSRRTDDVNDWLLDPAVTQQYSEAADRQQYNDSLVQALGQVQALTDALATYPQVDSALISRIGAAGGAEVSMAHCASTRRAPASSTSRAMCSSCKASACSARWTTPAIPMRTACTCSA